MQYEEGKQPSPKEPNLFPFESEEWRATRNALLREWIRDEFAVRFVLDWADICEVWDDLIDQDKEIKQEDVNRAFYTAIIELQLNPFLHQHKANLIPLLRTGINAWLDANILEKGEKQDRVFAYVLRDVYMEFVSEVICLTRGWEYLRSVSVDVRRFFTHHESLEDYLEKLK